MVPATWSPSLHLPGLRFVLQREDSFDAEPGHVCIYDAKGLRGGGSIQILLKRLPDLLVLAWRSTSLRRAQFRCALDDVVEELDGHNHSSAHLPITEGDTCPDPHVRGRRLDETNRHRRPHLHERERVGCSTRHMNLDRSHRVTVDVCRECAVALIVGHQTHWHEVGLVDVWCFCFAMNERSPTLESRRKERLLLGSEIVESIPAFREQHHGPPRDRCDEAREPGTMWVGCRSFANDQRKQLFGERLLGAAHL